MLVLDANVKRWRILVTKTAKTVTNISKSSTHFVPNTFRPQHSSPTSVTNIDRTLKTCSYRIISNTTKNQIFFKNRVLARNSFFNYQNYSEVNDLFCEINEGVCFTKMKKMNPEECQTECEINDMKVPSFYDLERFHNFHPPLVPLQKVEDTREETSDVRDK